MLDLVIASLVIGIFPFLFSLFFTAIFYQDFKRKRNRGMDATKEANYIKFCAVTAIASPFSMIAIPLAFFGAVCFGVFTVIKAVVGAFNYEYKGR